MGKAYRIKRADRAASEVDVGTIVRHCTGHDYGCANDDTRETGIHHVSVTLDPEGGYPFFTIPREDLEVVEPSHD
jgi:GH25 family lysozyme M1 (1,4-beta-N-acetylmuramidase)